MKKELSWISIAVFAFLAPLLGGQLMIDALPILPNQSTLGLVLSGAAETPLLTHGVLAILLSVTLWWIAVKHRVFTIPKGVIAGSIVGLGAFIVISLSITSFRFVSFAATSEWLIYLVAFFAACAVSGRGKGATTILAALVAGCTIVAFLGIQEYATNRSTDPTWRIFSTWCNSNALAGMLMIGLLIALGLMLTTNRLASLSAGIASGIIGFALVLTQSRGGLTAILVGLLVFMILVVITPGTSAERKLGSFVGLTFTSTLIHRMLRLLGSLALTAGFVTMLLISAKPSTTNVPTVNALSRFSTGSDHAREQSGSFRIMLWKSGFDLMMRNKVGYGMGTFRYESSRPGLVTPTHFAHESFIQLATEASWAAPICLLIAGVLWLWEMLKGLRKTPGHLGILRVAIVSAVVASACHNMLFDSDFYQFGIGVSFFMLLGVGLSLSADGTSPEYLPRPMRWVTAFATTIPVLCLLSLGNSKLQVSQALGAIQSGDIETAKVLLDKSKKTLVDGEPWYISARYVASSDKDRIDDLTQATNLTPSPKYFRALGRAQAISGNLVGATASYNSALLRDPNNFATLLQLVQMFDESGDTKAAISTAKRLVEVESKSYFTVRSISEYIPTETFEARIYLASHERSTAEKIKILKPAVDGLLQYLHITEPIVVKYVKQEVSLDFLGDNVDIAKRKLKLGRVASKTLIQLYRDSGRLADAETVGATLAEFEAGLAGLADLDKESM
jgi:hypothetical protein